MFQRNVDWRSVYDHDSFRTMSLPITNDRALSCKAKLLTCSTDRTRCNLQGLPSPDIECLPQSHWTPSLCTSSTESHLQLQAAIFLLPATISDVVVVTSAASVTTEAIRNLRTPPNIVLPPGEHDGVSVYVLSPNGERFGWSRIHKRVRIVSKV